ncbi:MAG: ParA family protein [Lachnospiraceae bacterium]|nr:ParA family protein [Lachnospiraceae bacterium]
MKHTTVICFANNKGGSGKSTTCSNLGAALAKSGKKVLMLDGDMQLNLSLSFLDEDKVLEYAKSNNNLYQAIKEQKDLKDYIVSTPYENVDLIPSSTLMSSIEYELFTKWQREFILRKLLKTVRESGTYDYILMDAPPTLGGWVMNLLCASDYLVIPVEASPWGLFGLANMFEFLQTTQEMAPGLSLLGIVITKVDERKNYFKQTKESLEALEDIHVFSSLIHVDSTVEWAQDNSKPVINYKPGSRSAKEYTALAEEIKTILQEA